MIRYKNTDNGMILEVPDHFAKTYDAACNMERVEPKKKSKPKAKPKAETESAPKTKTEDKPAAPEPAVDPAAEK